MKDNEFDSIINNLHDARVFGFLIERDYYSPDMSFILYVQIFSTYDFELDNYSLEKGLLIFESAKIKKLSIVDDLYGGQFFIISIQYEKNCEDGYDFIFTFNDPAINLTLSAKKIRLKCSGNIKKVEVQYLETNWSELLE
ncbi:hypothetical protein [Acinetobacter sp.]|uniref:hypothetical protein n=1 Tax=Acinetobacter sp. TaxID=472 RepID=UPI002FC737C9